MVDMDRLRMLPPFEVRMLIDDGNFGGRYQRDDAEMLEIWNVAVRRRARCWRAGDGRADPDLGRRRDRRFGRRLAKTCGHDITFVDVVAEHVAAIRSHGLRITGPVEQFSVTSPAFTPDELAEPGSAFSSRSRRSTLRRRRAPSRRIWRRTASCYRCRTASTRLIIQRIVGRDRTIGAFINFGADWMAPGEIMFGNRGAVVLGELDGAMTPRLAALHASCATSNRRRSPRRDIWSYLWGKLGYGAMLFAQALGQKGIARLPGAA